MDKRTLEKAKELEKDIESINNILKEHEKKHWVQIITPRREEEIQSYRLQCELVEWLRKKKFEYEKELEEL